MNANVFMRAALSRNIFDKIFDIKRECLSPVLSQYGVNEEELRETLWTEFDVPGMEVRIANTAFDFLISCCEEEKDLEDGLIREIRHCILYSGIFYTNIAPHAIHQSEFSVSV